MELSNILPKGLIKQIREEASTKVNAWQEHKNNMELLDTPRNKRKLPSDIEVEEISNALQMNVTGTTLEQMKKEIERCVTTRITMKEIFGKVKQSILQTLGFSCELSSYGFGRVWAAMLV